MALKIKLNFNKEALQLNGEPFMEVESNEAGQLIQTGKTMTLNKILANNIIGMTNESADMMKLTDWAKTIWNGEELELDQQDAEKLRKICRDFKISLIIKRQLVDVIDDAELAAKTDKQAPKEETPGPKPEVRAGNE